MSLVRRKFNLFLSYIKNMNADRNDIENRDVYLEPINGLFFSNNFLPQEVVIKVLGFVPWKDLLSCRLVCKIWKTLIDSPVCLEKIKSQHPVVLRNSLICPFTKLKTNDLPFYLCFAIANNVFGVNLLKNTFGEEVPNFKYWIISYSRGDGWIVEDIPAGSQPLPTNLAYKSCFVTSYGTCLKEQFINLEEFGANSKIMDYIQPQIEVSDWYAKRFDCGIVYKLKVCLLDSQKNLIDEFTHSIEDNDGDNDWRQVTHTFKNYGPGVRFIIFQHGGRDTQFWAGHYGSKMAGSCVTMKIDLAQLKQTAVQDA